MTRPLPPPETIGVAEAAQLLGWGPFKVYYYLSMGRIPGAREVNGEWFIDRAAMLAARDAGLLR